MHLTAPMYPIVQVVWIDADVNNDEDDNKTKQNPSIAHTNGYLVYRDEYVVSIVPEGFPETDSGRHKTTILMDNVVLIREATNFSLMVDRRDKLKAILDSIGGNY